MCSLPLLNKPKSFCKQSPHDVILRNCHYRLLGKGPKVTEKGGSGSCDRISAPWEACRGRLKASKQNAFIFVGFRITNALMQITKEKVNYQGSSKGKRSKQNQVSAQTEPIHSVLKWEIYIGTIPCKKVFGAHVFKKTVIYNLLIRK